jgi:hypothetical protein
MKTRALLPAMIMMLVVVIPMPGKAQHKHQPSGQKTAGSTPAMSKPAMQMNMSEMMKAPHHMLMMAYMKSMSEFTRTLRDQAMKPEALDVEFARATVAEIRHNLDAMEALHQRHMQTMSAEMQSKMQSMMEKMDKGRSMLRDQVSALEADVQADKPDAKQLTVHANALLKHLGMMSKMGGGHKTGMKMKMKKM